jgi:hypothetical protein
MDDKMNDKQNHIIAAAGAISQVSHSARLYSLNWRKRV